MSSDTKCYLREASDDAGETVRNFADEILEQLIDKGTASDDLLNDYPGGDAWHHESHVDRAYSFREAADLIVELGEFLETDSGLWEGKDLMEALPICAAFTYGNAVYNEWTDKIKQINEEAELIIDDFNDRATDLESAISDLNEEAEEADKDAEETEQLDSGLAANSARKQARVSRRSAADRQRELDDLDEEKKDALRKLIDANADTP